MTEIEFIESIDCKLPYGNLAKVRDLIALGIKISPNAAFMVLHEICRPPRGAGANPETQRELVAAWASAFTHPLVDVVLPIAESMIAGEAVSVGVSVAAMHRIAPYRNQYNALAIPYLACNDINNEADAVHREIVRDWARA